MMNMWLEPRQKKKILKLIRHAFTLLSETMQHENQQDVLRWEGQQFS